ncbi:hypothetical protein VPHD148_0165 [Vibrio phage D148]
MKRTTKYYKGNVMSHSICSQSAQHSARYNAFNSWISNTLNLVTEDLS